MRCPPHWPWSPWPGWWRCWPPAGSSRRAVGAGSPPPGSAVGWLSPAGSGRLAASRVRSLDAQPPLRRGDRSARSCRASTVHAGLAVALGRAAALLVAPSAACSRSLRGQPLAAGCPAATSTGDRAARPVTPRRRAPPQRRRAVEAARPRQPTRPVDPPPTRGDPAPADARAPAARIPSDDSPPAASGEEGRVASILDDIVAGVRDDVAAREEQHPAGRGARTAAASARAARRPGRAERTRRRRHRRGQAPQPVAGRAGRHRRPGRAGRRLRSPAARASSAC